MSGTFLEISEALDKVWHKGLYFKLKAYGVDGNLLKLLENYLIVRKELFYMVKHFYGKIFMQVFHKDLF